MIRERERADIANATSTWHLSRCARILPIQSDNEHLAIDINFHSYHPERNGANIPRNDATLIGGICANQLRGQP